MRTCVCRYCGKVYIQTKTGPKDCCKDCIHIEDEKFKKIEDYLIQYPNSNAIEVAEGLEISVMEVIRFIDSGRLVLGKGEFKEL